MDLHFRLRGLPAIPPDFFIQSGPRLESSLTDLGEVLAVVDAFLCLVYPVVLDVTRSVSSIHGNGLSSDECEVNDGT